VLRPHRKCEKDFKEVIKLAMKRISKVISFALILSTLLTTGIVAMAYEVDPLDTETIELEALETETLEKEQIELEPLYYVYKNGFRVNACVEIQHMIRAFAIEFDFCERVIFGMIVNESTFDPSVHFMPGDWRGLAQISPFWIGNAAIERFCDDYRSRDLFDAYDNLLTLMEIWSHARNRYNLDLTTEHGYVQLLFWHSTGRDPTNLSSDGTQYTRRVMRFVDELVEIQPQEDILPLPYYEQIDELTWVTPDGLVLSPGRHTMS